MDGKCATEEKRSWLAKGRLSYCLRGRPRVGAARSSSPRSCQSKISLCREMKLRLCALPMQQAARTGEWDSTERGKDLFQKAQHALGGRLGSNRRTRGCAERKQRMKGRKKTA